MKRFLGRAYEVPTKSFLVLKSGVLLVAIRVGLGLMPGLTISRILDKDHLVSPGETPSAGTGDRRRLKQVVHAVDVASRFVPGATCLCRALAVIALLGSGYSTALRIGVAKKTDGLIEAHAWVESDGVVVVGGEGDLSRFVVLEHAQGRY